MKITIVNTKRLFLALMVMLTSTMAASAMSYEQARNEALFLTDKMAYELNLTDEQYEAAYEINLDYLMGVTGRDDVFGTYWERRNLDLSYILLDWQWNAYLAATYFYRPLYWEAGYWHFGIYRRYPYRDYFYFGRPHFYATYRGGHAWHLHGGRGYYYGHRDVYRAPHREHLGMHDRWYRGDFRSPGHSSSRVTGPSNRRGIENRPNRGIENRNMNRGMENRQMNRGTERRSNSGSFGGQRGNGSPSRNSGTYNRTPSRSSGSYGSPSRQFNGSRNYGSSSHNSGSMSHSRPSRSFSGSSSHSSSRSSSSFSRGSSHSGGSHSSGHSGGSHSGGGSHFGGRR